jgi:nitrate reductase gamma subunit
VPFRITTTCGQQSSLPWIQTGQDRQPVNHLGRHHAHVHWKLSDLPVPVSQHPHEAQRRPQAELPAGAFLWIGALAFHYAFFTVSCAAFAFFLEPVPFFVTLLEQVDSFIRMLR